MLKARTIIILLAKKMIFMMKLMLLKYLKISEVKLMLKIHMEEDQVSTNNLL